MSAATDEREYPDQLTGWAAPSVERPPTPAEPAAAPLDRLLAALERHIAAEDEVLTSYRALVESTTDPVVALLLRHVGGEEEWHHGRLRGMATRLRDTLQWTHPPETPPAGHPWAASRAS
jgi:broad specificity phosphatase PhoE